MSLGTAGAAVLFFNVAERVLNGYWNAVGPAVGAHTLREMQESRKGLRGVPDIRGRRAHERSRPEQARDFPGAWRAYISAQWRPQWRSQRPAESGSREQGAQPRSARSRRHRLEGCLSAVLGDETTRPYERPGETLASCGSGRHYGITRQALGGRGVRGRFFLAGAKLPSARVFQPEFSQPGLRHRSARAATPAADGAPPTRDAVRRWTVIGGRAPARLGREVSCALIRERVSG